MRILIYGAGVIGSLYAVLFAEAGYDTRIYARGKRLDFLKKNGLLYKKNQKIRRAEATILGELSDNDAYDFILLTVRENQLYKALAELKNNKSKDDVASWFWNYCETGISGSKKISGRVPQSTFGYRSAGEKCCCGMEEYRKIEVHKFFTK